MKLTCPSFSLPTYPPIHPLMQPSLYKGLLAWGEGWLLCESQCRRIKLCSWWESVRVCVCMCPCVHAELHRSPEKTWARIHQTQWLLPWVGFHLQSLLKLGVYRGGYTLSSCSLILRTSDPIAFQLLIWRSPGYCECGFPGVGFGSSARTLHFTPSIKTVFTGASCQC